MECSRQRISYASWRLRVFQRLFAPTSTNSHTISPSSHRNLSSKQHPRESEDHNLDNDPSIRPSQLLPKSPLASIPTEKKRKLRAPPEQFQELARNPWAMALASPLRMCTVTGTRLPKAFLGDWGMIRRSNTADPEKLWIMPVGLLKDELSRTLKGPLNFLKLRIVDRLPLLKQLTKPLSRSTGGKKSPLVKLIPQRWKHPFGPMTSQEDRLLVWRGDMPDFVFGRLRKDALKKLKRACGEHGQEMNDSSRAWSVVELDGDSEALVEALKGVEPVERMGSGAVLVMGQKPQTQNQSEGLEESQKRVSNFPDYVTLPQVQSKVPVFDLSILLSECDMEALRAYDQRFQSTALFLRPDDTTSVDAVLALWKLKGFIRHDAQYTP
ncbi:uncharacterized protein ASPGLDRAFT_920431 [Aspergillus glaucus CBS 516.65]|uniref:Required for respiratory growth protein 8, mitochondrial n=1 Tax=Aspergillus glaucus CBS 516.65 TaxID=1160497 RepID=A0A1L9V7S0_ASPGL|nr:hypothetical protein ASPGLDRAFT_920431 [Aspergillus glaucus CBS 516.65]OJJ79892.1 hypothetical protein ASPGLDRAFT_920431 [Aspergillus glaucus CBS 516.65]